MDTGEEYPMKGTASVKALRLKASVSKRRYKSRGWGRPCRVDHRTTWLLPRVRWQDQRSREKWASSGEWPPPLGLPQKPTSAPSWY